MAQESSGDPATSSMAPTKIDEPDPRNSLRHLLTSDSDEKDAPEANSIWRQVNTPQEGSEHERPESPHINYVPRDKGSPGADEDEDPQYTSTTTTTRRNANGSVSSVYSGNKIRHLKKPDGEPLWRSDIQLAFLQNVFENPQKVFTSPSDLTPGHTFSEIYIDTMAKSSKSSKILKDKLMNDRPAAVNMAMVCLLVNVGRMNTTLNFFPEMRAALRTYHSIPSLQVKHAGQASKQLQDAPRLKSILKGAMEDQVQPHTVNEIMQRARPRTNPVNLIFVLSQYAPRISEVHFFPPRDFFDLVMRSTLSSQSRADAFLWLMWWYLESDFSDADSQNNPFGRGLEGPGSLNKAIKVPAFVNLTQEEADAENIDTEEEIAYGKAKKAERDAILATGVPPSAAAPKRLQRTPGSEPQQGAFRFKSPVLTMEDDGNADKYERSSLAAEGDSDRRSPSSGPSNKHNQGTTQPSELRINQLLNEDTVTVANNGAASGSYIHTPRKGIGRGNWPRPRRPKTGKGSRGGGSRLRSRNSFQGSPDHLQSSSVVSGYSPPLRPNSYSSSGYHFQQDGPAARDSGQGQSGATTAGGGTKRPRMLTAHQQALERSRQKRVAYLLDRKKREVQDEATKESKRRGTVVDAWIKASMIPSGWDSEEDEGHRIGGLDEASYERPGDVGRKAKKLSGVMKRWANWAEIGRMPHPIDPNWGHRNGTGVKSKRNHRSSAYDHASDIEMADVPKASEEAIQNGYSRSSPRKQTSHAEGQSPGGGAEEEMDEMDGDLLGEEDSGSESGSEHDTIDDDDTVMLET